MPEVGVDVGSESSLYVYQHRYVTYFRGCEVDSRVCAFNRALLQ